MRVLIVGASGFIGNYLRRSLLQRSDHEVSNTYNVRAPQDIDGSWHRLEITDRARMSQVFQETQPQVVVLLAAIADVNTAETDPSRATAVNVDAAAHVARLCTHHHARLIFLSSEYVFGGDTGNYREKDHPGPNTHYGWTKWQAELAVGHEASECSIVRTSLVYGWPLIGRQNMVTMIVDRLKNDGAYTGDVNTYRTPIYVEHLTESIVQMVDNYYPGIWHIAGNDWINMYEFACAVAEAFNMDASKVKSSQVSPSVRPTIDPLEELEWSPRPDILGLDCTQTSYRLGLRPSGVVSGLQEMLAREI